MATTAPTRVTDVTRSHRLDINTAADPSTNYEQVLGIKSLKLVEDLRTKDDEHLEDEGAMREEVTGYAWRLEATLSLSTNLAGTSRLAVHKFLRDKFVALRTGAAAANEFGVRFYDRNGLADEADEGRVYVKTWDPTDSKEDLQEVKIVLQGQGALTPITNPAASQVPVVSSVSPTGGGTAGGELVNIYGNHFTDATDVDFASDAADFTIVSDSHIVAIAPAHAGGTVQVKVTTAAGASANTSADDYLYA